MVQKQLGHHSISMTVDIYGHWIPGEGKKDLTKTLRGPKACPGRTLALVTGADSPQAPQLGNIKGRDLECEFTGVKTGAKLVQVAKGKGVISVGYASSFGFLPQFVPNFVSNRTP
jgi:hypothetical protein